MGGQESRETHICRAGEAVSCSASAIRCIGSVASRGDGVATWGSSEGQRGDGEGA